jgi:DNA-binding MarR family transcriptional regulator
MVYNAIMAKIKTAKQMERHSKGRANHHRIEILLFIAGNDGATLDDIVTALGANEKTLGEHTRRLSIAGLVNKKYRGKFVEHVLSPYGEMFVRFLQSFQKL